MAPVAINQCASRTMMYSFQKLFIRDANLVPVSVFSDATRDILDPITVLDFAGLAVESQRSAFKDRT
jgi:hypothetical protein